MSTHDPGTVYHDWRRAEVGLTQLEREIEATQITHPVDLYQPGSVRLERLYEQMALAQRFHSPLEFKVNL